jgi:lipopolysaccharide biosynthesis glycosyltransferase
MNIGWLKQPERKRSAMTTMYIGCATDRNFVEPTCAMLSSLDDNGEVAEAIVMVAAFGLEPEDKEAMRGSAGRLGPAMRFVDIEPGSPKIVALPTFRFPLPLLGRLILPGEIDTPGARLLLIDSDMIVNASVRALFEMDMKGRPLGAIQDPLSEDEQVRRGRRLDANYFNAGLLLLNLDVFNARNIGVAAMQWLADCREKPVWLDQDALNAIVGADWVRLGREWNFFYAGGDGPTREDYESARIVHFAGAKPWVDPLMICAPIYFRHLAGAHAKALWRPAVNRIPVDRDFIATLYEVLLGRELDSPEVIRDRKHWPATEVLASILKSEEFDKAVVQPLRRGESPPGHLFQHRLSVRHRYWIADRLPVLPETAAAVERAADWRGVLERLVNDSRLMSFAA